MTDERFIQTSYSHVDNNYGINWNRVKLDANVAPIKELDGMVELARWYPIDAVCEYYGIVKDQMNSLQSYLDKGIENNDNAIMVVEDHFKNIGMPIPGGLKKYQKQRFESNGFTESVDVLKTVEITGKTLEQIAEEKKLLDSNKENDGEDGGVGEIQGTTKEGTDSRPKKPLRAKIRRRRAWKTGKNIRRKHTEGHESGEGVTEVQPEQPMESDVENN